ncbi:slipin family protein [Berryella wangjianweii]|uniref:Slipin family protein n=1 Tax=Berryella wangjianweii TaxID=2734634 RepID=A0A6M8J5D8_9ACTN|nr:slipin family protein [Berryella wangjianweii]QKF07833.1 slipin family protein [Berryella wangjianweii]
MTKRFPQADFIGRRSISSKDEEILAATTYVPRKSSRVGTLIFTVAVFCVAALVGLLAASVFSGRFGVVEVGLAAVLGLLGASSCHIALSWERVVVLRFGKVNRVVGPGLYWTIPIVEFATIRVDQRVVATPFSAEKTLTADLVPINIDAVLYWLVRDPEEACTEVEDYFAAVSFLAQTAMREAVGRSTVAEVALRRDQLDSEIEGDISKEASEWGIDIIAVKVRDIVLPDSLQESMSLEAQADREKSARVTVASAEVDVAEMLADAARVYDGDPLALNLRTMLMQYDTVKVSSSSVVTVPSAVSDGFVDKGSEAQTK